MNIEEAIDSVYSFVTTEWNAAATGVTLAYDETPGLNDRPTDSLDLEASPKVTVMADILSANHKTLGSTGNRRFRRFGVLTVRILTPRNQGRLLEDRYATILFDSLEGASTPEGIDFGDVTPLAGFNVGVYRVKQINVAFDYDEIK